MNEETINRIDGLLVCEVERLKDDMLTAIECNYGWDEIKKRMERYRDIRGIKKDFDDWCERQEDEHD